MDKQNVSFTKNNLTFLKIVISLLVILLLSVVLVLLISVHDKEKLFRYAGVFFQILGIGISYSQLSFLKKKFDYPSILSHISNIIKKYFSSSDKSGSITPQAWTIECEIPALTAKGLLVQSGENDLEMFKNEMRACFRDLKNDVNVVSGELTSFIERTQKGFDNFESELTHTIAELREYLTNGLHLAEFGVWCFFAGCILSSLSTELSFFIKSVAQFF